MLRGLRGRRTVQSSAAAAFDDYVDESGIGSRLPVEGYRLEREQARRALLSYDVRDRSKVAVILADGILNIGGWEDASGERLPVTRVRSYQGAEHCSWTDITFLLIGPDDRRADWYVRDATREFPGYLRGEFDRDAKLPDDATFTGWSRGGQRLWLGPDKQAAYLVDGDDPHVVERWPAATEPVLCA